MIFLIQMLDEYIPNNILENLSVTLIDKLSNHYDGPDSHSEAL